MKRSVLWIFFLFLLLRIILLFHLPIFNDESIYMRWGLGFLARPDRWWAWMLDGKQPAVAISFGIVQLLPIDPLISMRLMSITFAAITYWMVYGITKRLFPKQDPTFVLLFIAICPYLILFDTLALAESPVTTAFTLALWMTISLIQKPAWWKGLLLGVIVAAGWWFKSTILLSIPIVLVSLFLYWKNWKKRWIEVTFGVGLGAVVGFAMMVPVLFNPNMAYATTAIVPRTLTISQVLAFPWSQWRYSSIAVVSWFIAYGGVALIVLFLAACWQWRTKKEMWLLAFWTLLPTVAEAFLLVSLSGRLLALTSIPFIILCGMWVAQKGIKPVGQLIRWGSVMVVGSLGILLVLSPIAFYRVLGELPAAQSDFGQYVTGWPSGWGVKEAIDTVFQRSIDRPFIVFVRLDSGNPEDAVISYFERANIPVYYVQDMSTMARVPELTNADWYFISRGAQYGGLDKYVTELARFKKPLDSEFVGVYRINKK